MAATNFTPIQLYFSTTASAVPLAANLAQGELAININDGKLYYEDSAGAVQVIATKGAGTIGGSTTQIQYNNAGALAGNAAMVFNNSTNVTTLTTLNLTNALGAIYGGTAQSTYAQGDVLYASASNTLAKLGIGANTYILTSTGSVPQWVAPSSIAVLTATNLAGGLAGSVPYQSALDTTTFLAIGAANRVMTSTGTAPQWVTSLTGLTGVSSTSLTASTTLGVTGVSTLTAGAIVQGLTVGLGAGAVATNTAVGVSALAANTTGSANIGIGYQAGKALTTGTDSVAIGTNALITATTTGNNIGIGSGALQNTTGSFNIGVGSAALQSNSSGGNNTALGYQALIANTTASENTAVGYQTAYTNTTGTGLTAIGLYALRSNTTANYNTAVGYSASQQNTTGASNASLGTSALYANTTGSFNVALGRDALSANTTASNNTAVGYGALALNTTASNNTAVGYQAGYTNSTATQLTAFGVQAGYTNNADNNAFFGYQAGYSNTTGTNNAAFGAYRPLYTNTTGAFNTAIGDQALYSNTTASNNTAVGYQAGYSNTTATRVTAIGMQAGYSGTTGSNYSTYVGYKAGYLATGQGNVCIGDSTGESLTTGAANTFIGANNAVGGSAGQLITSGSKNTILGSYNGNQGGLDIRTASNYIVLSDGDGNPKLISPGSNNWALGVPVAGTVWRDASPTLVLQYGGLRSERYTTNNVQVKLTNNVYENTSTGYQYITTDFGSMYIQIAGSHKWECAPSGTAGDAVTFTQVLAAEKDKSVALQGAVSQSGAGITFPATQSASSNANTLDDYEEGTWTPALAGTSAVTYSNQVGYYTKVGRLVTITMLIQPASVTYVSSTAQLKITGLPFTPVAVSYDSANSWGAVSAQNLGYSTSGNDQGATATSAVAYVNSTPELKVGAIGQSTKGVVNNSAFPGSSVLETTITYFV